VSQKNYNDVAHYNFNAHQLILVIFDRNVAERVCNQIIGRGATGSRGSIDPPPLFQVRGPTMVLDPALLSGSLAIITAHTAQTHVQNVNFAELIL